MDTQSKPTFVPRGHHLLFVCLLSCLVSFLVCLFILLLVMSPANYYACHVYHAYLLYGFSYALCTFSFHFLVYWFLVFAFACTHIEHLKLCSKHTYMHHHHLSRGAIQWGPTCVGSVATAGG